MKFIIQLVTNFTEDNDLVSTVERDHLYLSNQIPK